MPYDNTMPSEILTKAALKQLDELLREISKLRATQPERDGRGNG